MKRFRYSAFAGLILAVGLLSCPRAARAAEVEGTVVAAALSADNSLSTLSISNASLSPDFYYSTVKYTATVPFDVTEVAVTATTSNANAEITSISGNENLSVGENIIQVVVVAENGNEATYTITLTRSAGEEQQTGSDDESAPDGEAADSGGNDYSETEPESGEEAAEPVFIYYGDYGLTVVNPPEGQVPDTMEQVSLEVDGTQVSCAYQYAADRIDAAEDFSAYYFLYGTDSFDVTGWFMYDSRVGNFSRFIGQFMTAENEESADGAAQTDTAVSGTVTGVDSDEYAQLLADYNTVSSTAKQLEQKIRLMTAVFLFIVAILLVIMFSILWTKRNDEFDDGEVFEDEEEPIKKEKTLETIPVERAHKVADVRAKEPITPKEPENFAQTPEASGEERREEQRKAEQGERRKSSGKKKRRDSILAYLGLDDDLPLDYGDVIEDETEDWSEPETKPEVKQKAKPEVKQKAKPEAEPEARPEERNKQERREDDAREDDIEFIDL